MRIQIDGIERDATSEEIARIERIQSDAAAYEAQLMTIAAAKVSARSKLAALGLTEAELAALLGA